MIEAQARAFGASGIDRFGKRQLNWFKYKNRLTKPFMAGQAVLCLQKAPFIYV